MQTCQLEALPIDELESLLEKEKLSCSAMKLHLADLKDEIQQSCKQNEISENNDLNKMRRKIQAMKTRNTHMLSSARMKERQIKHEMREKVDKVIRDSEAIHQSIAMDNSAIFEALQARLNALTVDHCRVEVDRAFPASVVPETIPDGASPALVEQLHAAQAEKQRHYKNLAQLRQEIEQTRSACEIYIHRLASLQMRLVTKQQPNNADCAHWEAELGLPHRRRRYSSAH